MIGPRPRVLAITLWLQIALAAPARYSYRVVRVYPHDRDAFTQGLEFRAGYLYESTGLNGHSRLRKVELESGRVLQEIPLPDVYFGEGITVMDQRIVQLTWQSHKGFIYDQNSFRLLRSFEYAGEGWGLTNDGRQIYMSDGTSAIRCWDGVTLAEKRRFSVHDGPQPVDMLNELEFVKGELYANVWQTDKLVRFSPEDGHVTAWVDLSGLLNFVERATADVLNGIAYDAPGDRFFVTGKHWPKLFEIKLEPKR
jgi:glutaminyl-peptide cyclotransferase